MPTDEAASGAAYEIVRSGRSKGSTNSRATYDGDPGTVWTTDGSVVAARAFVWVDLGSDRPIGEIRWLITNAVAGATLTIEVSSDRRSWVEVTAVSDFAPGEWRAVETDLTGRYVRFTFANPAGAPVIGYVAEIEVAP